MEDIPFSGVNGIQQLIKSVHMNAWLEVHPRQDLDELSRGRGDISLMMRQRKSSICGRFDSVLETC